MRDSNDSRDIKEDFRQKYLQELPATGKLVHHPKVMKLLEIYPRRLVMESIQRIKEDARAGIVESEDAADLKGLDLSIERFTATIATRVDGLWKPSMGQRVINATGIVLSTSLGRAPLSKPAQEALRNVSAGYSPLAVNMETGRRGDRDSHVQELLSMLTGAEAATVANNNAAATLLILNTLAEGKEVIISRGQLVEIGGAFQLPDVVLRSGAALVEVGTTNRTHLRSYQEAISGNTGAIFRVHPSNYQIVGFTGEVPLSDLVALGREHNIPVVDDLGSGAFVDLSKYGLPAEPLVSHSIEIGADVVCFSGDKLLSGPQAGIILGNKEHIQMIKKNPLARMLRVGKLTVAALEATLRMYLDEDTIVQNSPTLRLLIRPLDEINEAAEMVVDKLTDLSEKARIEVVDGYSQVGGGSLPMEELPTRLLSIEPLSISADALGRRLRSANPPVFSRIQRECVLLDIRTVLEDEVEMLATALENSL